MRLNQLFIAFVLATFVLVISFENAYAEESIQIEVKYNNGDRADFYGMKLVVYQDFDKTIFLEKQLENNPDTITVPENHRYKIEVYANGMYAGVGYVQLDNDSENITINIPLSGGLKFNVFYQDGKTPMEGARIVVKSNDGTEWRQGITNNQGETLRYWIQSTTNQDEYYIADVFLGNLFLKSQYPIKLQAGLSTDEKIITDIPEIVENLITINLYEDPTTKITPSDEKITVTLTNLYGENKETSEVNFRGEAYFDNIKSGSYTAKITPDSSDLWPEMALEIVGSTNEFNIFKIQNQETDENTESIQIESCNCIAFRFDDVQDYWLNDVQIQYMNVFVEKEIPFTAGIIANSFGEDAKMFEFINQNKNNFEIASHGVGNTPFTEFTKDEQDTALKQSVKYIKESLETTPKTFIPPQNRFNEDTKQVLLDNGFTHISASILHGDSPPFPLKDAELYRFPEISTTGTFDPEQYAFVGISHEETFSESIEGLEKYGFAVIVSHPQEFSTIINGTYTNDVNEFQISELEKLIEKIQENNINIVTISEINSNSESIVPEWIKNNAGWWAEGAINDETFVQGIEFLVKEKIILVSEESQTGSNEKIVPEWIKNNAGWWAEDICSRN
jgi:peptidoglycan/xylan/chitin deacetylase (PgdA/CDA1 family)